MTIRIVCFVLLGLGIVAGIEACIDGYIPSKRGLDWYDDPQRYTELLWLGWGSASFVVVVVIGWWLHKRRQWRREWEEAKKAWDDSKN